MLPSSFFLEIFNDGARRGYADTALPHAPVRTGRVRRRPLRRIAGERRRSVRREMTA